MGFVLRWAVIVAAVLGVGLALVRSGSVDRFLPEMGPLAPQQIHGAPPAAMRALAGPNWARIRVGSPSGADPIVLEEELPSWLRPALGAHEPLTQPEWTKLPGQTDQANPPATPPYPRRRVEQGTTLSQILLEHYGRQGPKLAAAVARHNGLRSADAIRAGRELELPPLEILEAARSGAAPAPPSRP